MASKLPIPQPPRTPTPPPDDSPVLIDAGEIPHDPTSLSPRVLQNGPPSGRLFAFDVSPVSPTFPSSLSSDGTAGPFNFQPTTMAKSPVIKSV